jgi:glycosyltransferase involved in cell wall biosynthesis
VPAVSVIIPTRDREALLREAVASALAQRGTDLEVVVVDDASSDGTLAWASRHPDPRVRVVHLAERSERSAARNAGLAVAEGRLVLFLDDDDRLRPTALRRLGQALERHPGAAGAVGAAAFFDAAGQRRRIGFPRVPFVAAPWREVLAGWVAVPGQALLRTEVLRDLGGFRADLSVAEDQELWMRLAGRHCVAFVPAVVVERRLHGPSRDHPRGLELEQELRRAYLERCPPARRRAATRAARAHPILRRAEAAFGADDYRLALASLLEALSRDPSLLVSPVVGPGLVLAAAKAGLGAALPGPVARAARRGLRRVRRAAGREPQRG